VIFYVIDTQTMERSTLHGFSGIYGMDGGANPLLVAHLTPLLELGFLVMF
jgi:hypothetical protein